MTAAPNANLLWIFLRRSRSALIMAVLAGIVSGGATTALIAVINAWLKAQTPAVPTLAWCFAALCILRLATGVGCHVLLNRLSQGAIFDLRTQLCRTILATPLRQLEATGNHRLMASFTEDMVSIANVVINLPYMFVNAIILAGCLLYIGWLSWPMLAGILACLALGALSYLVPVVWANRRLRSARKEQDRLFEHFRGLTEGIKQLKLHVRARQSFLESVLIPSADSVRQHNVSGITIYSAAANWNRLLFFVYVGLLLLLASALLSHEATGVSGYILILLYMMAPLEAIMNALPHVAQANVALKHIAALDLSLQSAGCENGHDGRLDASQGVDLQLEGVRYTYRDGNNDRRFSLGPIDLSLRSGEVVFLVGGNGSGKTTLAKLITGLYLADLGQIRLNGERLEPGNLESYRELFSVVFSDPYLFDSLLGMDAPELDAQARRYLEELQLDHKLTIENGVFSTTALSNGQRKRLALLVALLENKPIYVFDEWAAGQDPRFKEVFYERILPRLKQEGKAVLAIAHDDRYFDRADRILKLEDGHLVGVEPAVILAADGSRT